MNIRIYNSIVCIGTLKDVLAFKECLFWERESLKYKTLTGWIYAPKTIKIDQDNMTALVTDDNFIFLSEFILGSEFEKYGFTDTDKIFAIKSFSRCKFLFRVSCDWDSRERNNFSRIDIWTDNQKIYEKKTLEIALKDNDIIEQYNWLLRHYSKFYQKESCPYPENEGYIVHKIERDSVPLKECNITLKQLWQYYVINILCKGNGQYPILVVISIIADYLYAIQIESKE